jgi:starvation-inducible outer membrane lipoprotein
MTEQQIKTGDICTVDDVVFSGVHEPDRTNYRVVTVRGQIWRIEPTCITLKGSKNEFNRLRCDLYERWQKDAERVVNQLQPFQEVLICGMYYEGRLKHCWIAQVGMTLFQQQEQALQQETIRLEQERRRLDEMIRQSRARY